MAIDIAAIRSNAQKDSIPLSQIVLIYSDLNDDQFETLNARGLIVENLGNGKSLGRFAPDGEVLYPEMASGVLYLGA